MSDAANRVALLSLWSRLELLRAAGVDTAPLRDEVRAKLLAHGFDPLAPDAAPADTGAAAATADLQAAAAGVETEAAAVEKKVAEYQQLLDERVGELPAIDEPLPQQVLPELPADVAAQLASADPAVALAGLTAALGLQAKAALSALDAATASLQPVLDHVAGLQSEFAAQLAAPASAPVPALPATDDPVTLAKQLQQTADELSDAAKTTSEQLDAMVASLPVDPASITLPDVPTVFP